MSNVVVIGSQWGDEGKGKVVDWLSERADVIVRFQGGHNAGHTLVVDGTVYKLSLLPSGVVRPGKLSIIGNGVVIDPWELLKEINKIRGQGVEINNQNLKIAENAALILPIHSHLDKAAEAYRGGKKIGTTGRGIGPAYEDKIARRAIRLCDLEDEALLNEKLDNMLFHHNSLIRGFDQEEMKKEEILAPLMEIRDELLSFAAPVWMLLEDARRREKRILFEGAQGTMLDVDHGTYPFVTSSNTVAGMASAGSGIGVGHVGYILGITKAYTTRVGSGPFPTELNNEIGQYLGEKGHEFGTVTGRKRRCGWFDAVMVRQAVKLSGMHGICLTKLDVLDGLEELNICVGYELNGERLTHFPAGQHIQGELKPIYETMPGWSESTMHARSWAELPAAAVKYAKRIEELIDAPIALLSTSPEREDMIRMTDPFQP